MTWRAKQFTAPAGLHFPADTFIVQFRFSSLSTNQPQGDSCSIISRRRLPVSDFAS
jgi:hypothetical protein